MTEGRAWWERYGQVGSVGKLVCKREEGFESLYNNPLVVPYPITQKLGMVAQTVILALSMWRQEDWESEVSPGKKGNKVRPCHCVSS